MRMWSAVIGLAALGFVLAPRASAQKSPAAEKSNMELVGWSDLQGRSAYQPLVHKQGDRFIAYIGHHGGPSLNPLTGKQEDNGTSILDVTNPETAEIPRAHSRRRRARPKPAARRWSASATAARCRARTGARSTCCAASGARRTKSGTSPIRRSPAGSRWSSADCATRTRAGGNATPGSRTSSAGAPDWRTRRMTMIYDLSDPAKPVFIRHFGLPGQQPGSTGPVPTDLHGPISTGPRGNRVYFGYGTGGNGVLQIVDRNKLLNGPKEPTDANLLYPQVARIDLPADAGAHTAFPMLGMQLAEFANQKLRPGTAAAAGIEHDHDGAAPATDAGGPRLRGCGRRVAGQRVLREPADGADGRRHRRVEAVRRLDVDRPRSQWPFLRPRRPLRHALVQREHDADLLQPRAVHRPLQRRRARARRPRSVQHEGNRLLHPGGHRQDRQALRRHGRRARNARSRSRPTTWTWTTAGTSTSPIAPTPACTSSNSPVRRRKVANFQ